MKNAAGNIAIGAGILFALMGAGKGSAVLNIFGNKGQVGANVIVSGQRIGKMKRDGEARSHFSERISPGDHVVKLTGNGQELWSKEITVYEGMEYFLDSSEGRTFTPPVYKEPEVKKSTAPAVSPASPPVNQTSAAEESPFSTVGKMLNIFGKKPVPAPVNPVAPAASPAAKAGKPSFAKAPEGRPVQASVKKTKVTESKPAYIPTRQTYVSETKTAYSLQGNSAVPASEGKSSYASSFVKTTDDKKASAVTQTYVPESKPAPPPAKPSSVLEGKPISSSDYQGGSGGIRWLYDPGQAFKLAKSRKKPVMLGFYADSNEQCRKLDSEAYSNKEIIDLSEKFIAVKVNAERYPNEVSRYKISGYPTVIFLGSNGKEKTRMNGCYDTSEFYKIMSDAAK